MIHELALARLIHEKHGIPISEKPVERIERDAGSAMRKALRMESDGLIHAGLMGRNTEEIAAGIGGTMTATAGALLQLGVNPGVPDLVAAAKELIEDARILLDNGITFSELDQIAVGAVALEVICRGIAATLSIPYRSVLEACTASYVDGKPADRDALRALITKGAAEGQKIETDAAAPPAVKPTGAKKRKSQKNGATPTTGGV